MRREYKELKPQNLVSYSTKLLFPPLEPRYYRCMSTHVEQVTTAFYLVEDTIDALLPTLDRQLWEQSDSGLVSAKESLTEFRYRDGQDGRTTLNSCAVVTIDECDVSKVICANEAKDTFKRAIKALKNQDPQHLAHWQESIFNSRRSARTAIGEESLGRINLKAVWRSLRLIVSPVQKLSFDWYNSGRSIKRITKAQAVDQLLKLEREGRDISYSWRKLSNLSDYTNLCIVQKQAPLVRANLLHTNGERTAFNSALPIFLQQAVLPEISALKPAADIKPRQQRSDAKIDPIALIPELRLHKYRA